MNGHSFLSGDCPISVIQKAFVGKVTSYVNSAANAKIFGNTVISQQLDPPSDTVRLFLARIVPIRPSRQTESKLDTMAPTSSMFRRAVFCKV
jgi:hypothetical protein